MPHTHTPTSPEATSPAALAASQHKAANPTPDLAEAITRGYEPHDIGLKALFTFLGVLVVSLVVVFAIIFAIMMALVEHDRARDQVGSTLTVKDIGRGPVYAPLQPSVDHPTLDADDMTAMRAETADKLNNGGQGENGRKYIPIGEAMSLVLPLLEKRPAAIEPLAVTEKVRLDDADELRKSGYILAGDDVESPEKASVSPK